MEYNYELLRKCHGLRFRATICNKSREGIIKVTSEGVILCYGQEDPGYLATFGRRDTLSFSKETFAILPSDFEIVPRDPETYKDWQVGDKVHYPNGENDIVIFRSGELVVLTDDFTEENRDVTVVNTCSQLFDRREGHLVLTDFEQQIIEGKKVVEDIPEETKTENYDFTKFAPVLVRQSTLEQWRPSVFWYMEVPSCFPFVMIDGTGWSLCLPLNDKTVHLLGTNDDYEEK